MAYAKLLSHGWSRIMERQKMAAVLVLRVVVLVVSILAELGAEPTNDSDGSAPLLRIVRPSVRDFVEVVRGGEMASEMLVALRDDFAVPSNGYLVVRGWSSDEPTILCPNSVELLVDCERDAEKQLTGTFRLTLFGVELGPQEVCVEAYNWDSMLLLNTCRTVVGSEQFPGLRESLHYYEDHADEFVGSDAMHLLWSRIGALQGGDAPFALLSIGARSGGQLQARYFLQRDGADRPTHLNVTAAEALVVCLGAGCSGEHDSGVFRVSPDGTQQRIATITRDTPLDTVWAQHGAREGNELRAFEIDASVPAPHELVDALSNTLAAAEPVLLLHLPRALNRTTLSPTIAALDSLGYHTFLAGTERLLILNGDMWHPSFALPLPRRSWEGGGEADVMTYVAVKAAGALYPQLLSAYNSSGMVIGCVPYRMSSFHTPDGYWADDCPPNFNVYRSSRLKHFEVAMREGWKVHEASLLRYRRNVFSEAGEDGIVRHIVERAAIGQGVCFEFGAWDGLFASNCRWWYEQGWAGILVEADSDKFKTLKLNYRNLPDVALVNAAVTALGDTSIYSLAMAHGGGRDIDILSIDVDGLDYELLSSLKAYPQFKPAVIIVESNAFVRPDLRSPLSAQASSNNLQQSLTVFKGVGEELGYKLVCFTQNAILVRDDLAARLEYPCSVNRLYLDALVVNWNDMLLNVKATRGGHPTELVEAETAQFGDFSANISLSDLRARALAEEAAAGSLCARGGGGGVGEVGRRQGRDGDLRRGGTKGERGDSAARGEREEGRGAPSGPSVESQREDSRGRAAPAFGGPEGGFGVEVKVGGLRTRAPLFGTKQVNNQ